jgi:hypothetical protein
MSGQQQRNGGWTLPGRLRLSGQGRIHSVTLLQDKARRHPAAM